MKSLLFWMLWLSCVGWCAAQVPPGERVWTRNDGKTFRGSYVQTLEGGSKVELKDAQGRIYQVSVDALSAADQALLKQPAPVLRELPPLDRSKIPVINQGDFGQKSNDCVPSSFCNFLLWWDQEKALEIPKRGDFDKKSEWVHTVMARLCVTRNNSGTSLSAAKEGFEKYFKTEMAGVAVCDYQADYDLRPENMARHTVGSNATMMGMTILDSRNKESGHWVALISVDPDGKVVFHTWGARFEGDMKVLEAKPNRFYQIEGQRVPATKYEIVLRNPEMLPEWVRESGIRFILDPEKWDGVFIVKPKVIRK